VDVKQSGSISSGFLARTDQAQDLLLLICLELGPATTDTTLFARHIKGRTGETEKIAR